MFGWSLKPDAIRLRFVGGWDTTDQECERLAVDLEQHGFLRRETSDFSQSVPGRDETIQRVASTSARLASASAGENL